MSELQDVDAIVTPVCLEMIVGTVTKHELELTRAYLDEFDVLDRGDVRPKDWEEARRIAERIPPDGKPRDLGDCLIRAIANRLKRDVLSLDAGFPS